MTARKAVGRIIIPGGMQPPEPHEYATADVFARIGKDVEFISPSRMRGAKTPDVKIDGVLWEMKSPVGSGKATVERQLRRAGKQSKNIIFDGRRTKLPDRQIESDIRRQFALSRSLQRVRIVRKDETVVEIKRW